MRGQSQTSVVIPVRDGARFIAAAVRSVLAQLGPDDEVLVVDDASQDETRQVLAGLTDARLNVLNGGRRGVSAARNIGLAAARGEFVAFLDHDDLWPPGRQAALLSALRAAPSRDAAFGRIRMMFEPGAVMTAGAQGLDGKHICELVGSGLYRRSAARAVGGFCETMHLREDADFHMRLIEAGLEPLLCDNDGLIYRRHDANATIDEAALTAALLDLARRKLARRRR